MTIDSFNNPLAIGLLCQWLSLFCIGVALFTDHERIRRMMFILGVGLLFFGAVLVDMEVLV